MKPHYASLQLIQGPQQGDAISLVPGTCRLIGRHLSEGETAALDQHGQRIVHQTGIASIIDYLKKQPANTSAEAQKVKTEALKSSQDPAITADGAFERGVDVIVGDETISRAHAMFYYDMDQLMGVVDLGSRNGTRVNGKSITACLLRDGDEVAMGNTVMRVISG